MKENKYDDETFFAKYAEMDRSKLGLAGAGEWRTLERMLPDFRGKRVLDLGCGYGWHCSYAAERGAAQVLGIDLSQKMLDVAAAKNCGSVIAYRRCALEDYEYPADRFDVALSSLTLHYVRDYDRIVRLVARTLAPGGAFVFSAEHPVFTAEGSQNWVYGADASPLYFPVDRYFSAGERAAEFLGERVTKYHRTLTEYFGALLDCGFEIVGFAEPQPPEDMLGLPGMRDELRRPMMMIVSARKK